MSIRPAGLCMGGSPDMLTYLEALYVIRTFLGFFTIVDILAEKPSSLIIAPDLYYYAISGLNLLGLNFLAV